MRVAHLASAYGSMYVKIIKARFSKSEYHPGQRRYEVELDIEVPPAELLSCVAVIQRMWWDDESVVRVGKFSSLMLRVAENTALHAFECIVKPKHGTFTHGSLADPGIILVIPARDSVKRQTLARVFADEARSTEQGATA